MNEIIQKLKERRNKKTPLQLRYGFNIKKNNSKEKLIINTSTLIMYKKYGYFFKNKKNLTVDNNYISKSKIIQKNLKKYNTTPIKFEKKIINSLIFDGKSHLISLFKDLLFWDDDVECFKRLYNKKECIFKIKKFEQFYRINYNSLKIFPIFFHLGECNKVFFKYYQQKYKLQKEINKEKKKKKNQLFDYINEKKKEKFSIILNIQSQSHHKLTSLSLNLSKENLNDIYKEEKNIEYYNIIDNDLSNKNIIYNNQTRNNNKNNLSFSFDNETVKSILKNLTKTIFPKENINTIINNNINNQYNNNNNLINNNNYIIKKYYNNKNYYNKKNTFKKKEVDIVKKTINESEKNTTNFLYSNPNKKKRNNQKISFKFLSSTNSFYKLPMLINNKKKERNESKKLKLLSFPKKNLFCFTERSNLFKEKKTIKIINTNDNNNRNKIKFRTTNISPSKYTRNFLINQNKKGK